MADSSLDDFFAKKDKNKKTKKKGGVDEGSKRIDDLGKITAEKPKKEKERPAANNAATRLTKAVDQVNGGCRRRDC